MTISNSLKFFFKELQQKSEVIIRRALGPRLEDILLDCGFTGFCYLRYTWMQNEHTFYATSTNFSTTFALGW